MDIYKKRKLWMLYLAIAGVFVIALSLFYTNYIAKKLAQEEKNKVALLLEAINEISKNIEDTDKHFDIPQKIIQLNNTVPIILVSETGLVLGGINFGEKKDTDLVFLKKELEKIKATGQEPIEGYAQNIYFKESKLLTLLRYYPLVQFILIAGFIFFGYLMVNSSRIAEQNQVWVGMAKETAHQLGTPITAIIGWLEYLKELALGNEEIEMVATEMENDVMRLNLIAERFSKIGSKPELKVKNIFDEIETSFNYMAKRAPRKVKIITPNFSKELPVLVKINGPLFQWVIENLIRNALDALEGKGEIKLVYQKSVNEIELELSDTGKGMNINTSNNLFKPGFTTKKRGWGLGLSLAKRIIENYHLGKIFVKETKVNVGTTFSIKMPIVEVQK